MDQKDFKPNDMAGVGGGYFLNKTGGLLELCFSFLLSKAISGPQMEKNDSSVHVAMETSVKTTEIIEHDLLFCRTDGNGVKLYYSMSENICRYHIFFKQSENPKVLILLNLTDEAWPVLRMNLRIKAVVSKEVSKNELFFCLDKNYIFNFWSFVLRKIS